MLIYNKKILSFIKEINFYYSKKDTYERLRAIGLWNRRHEKILELITTSGSAKTLKEYKNIAKKITYLEHLDFLLTMQELSNEAILYWESNISKFDPSIFNKHRELREIYKQILPLVKAAKLNLIIDRPIKVKQILVEGLAQGEIFNKKYIDYEPITLNEDQLFLLKQTLLKQYNNYQEYLARLEKVLWRLYFSFEAEGLASKDIWLKPEILALQKSMKFIKNNQIFLEVISNNVSADFFQHDKLKELTQEKKYFLDEIIFLFETVHQQDLGTQLVKNSDKQSTKNPGKPYIVYIDRISLAELMQIKEQRQIVQGLVLNRKTSHELEALLKYEKLPTIVLNQSINQRNKSKLHLTINTLDGNKEVLLNPSKQSEDLIKEKQKILDDLAKVLEQNKKTGLTKTIDGEEVRLMVNLGNPELRLPAEVEIMLELSADGCGNFYAERIVPYYVYDFFNWKNKNIEEKKESLLVKDCFYPIFKQIAANLRQNRQRDKFQLHLKNINLSPYDLIKFPTLAQAFALLGINYNNPEQKYRLDLLKDPVYTERLVYPLQEAIILALDMLRTELNHDLKKLPLVSFSSSDLSTPEELELHNTWLETCFQNLQITNDGLLEKGVVFNSYFNDLDKFKAFAAALVKNNYKYFIGDTTQWALKAYNASTQQNYQDPKHPDIKNIPYELNPIFLNNLNDCLKHLYDSNKAIPDPKQRLRIIVAGNLPKFYSEVALFYSHSISCPIGDIDHLHELFSVTPYKDSTEHKTSITRLVNENHLLFYKKADPEMIDKLIFDNENDYHEFHASGLEMLKKRKEEYKKIDEIILERLIELENLRSRSNRSEEPGETNNWPENLEQIDALNFRGNYTINFDAMHFLPTNKISFAINPFIKAGYLQVNIFRNDDPGNVLNGELLENWFSLVLLNKNNFTVEYKILNKMAAESIVNIIKHISKYFQQDNDKAPIF